MRTSVGEIRGDVDDGIITTLPRSRYVKFQMFCFVFEEQSTETY